MINLMNRLKKPMVWIYCSAILLPLVFSLMAAVIRVARFGRGGDAASVLHEIAATFYMILMAIIASVPRLVLPALAIWLLTSRFRPDFDENKLIRYAGLLVLVAGAVFLHSMVYRVPFNLIWLAIAYLATILPRLAIPSLKNGLHTPA